jgi:membrane protein required for colicin V production
MGELSTFDIIVASLILFLGLKGFIDGFVRELFGLVGIIGGIYFASRYAQQVGEFISQNIYPIKNSAALSFVGFIATLAAIWIAMVLLANLFTKLANASAMGSINHILGLVFGWIKMFLIFSVLVYAASNIELTKRMIGQYTKNSLLYPLMLQAGGAIIHFSPSDFVSGEQKKSDAPKEPTTT